MKDDVGELKGICLECGAQYSGQVLKQQRYQICVKCGSNLEVREDGIIINTPNEYYEILIYRFNVEKSPSEGTRKGKAKIIAEKCKGYGCVLCA